MGKGIRGISCKKAVLIAIRKIGEGTADEIYTEIKQLGSWADNTIYRHIMGLTINLQPAYWEWPQFKEVDKCLFHREDGYFEWYKPEKQGYFLKGIKERGHT